MPDATSAVDRVNSAFAGRPVTKLHGRIPAGEFLVYRFLAQENLRCDGEGKVLNGSNEAGLLFRPFEEARAFAEAGAEIDPRIGYGIYNSNWQTVTEFISGTFLRQQAKANAPGRSLLIAGVLLIAGSVCIWYEVRSGWTAVVSFLIGARLLLSGFLKLAHGLYRLIGFSQSRP